MLGAEETVEHRFELEEEPPPAAEPEHEGIDPLVVAAAAAAPLVAGTPMSAPEPSAPEPVPVRPVDHAHRFRHRSASRRRRSTGSIRSRRPGGGVS